MSRKRVFIIAGVIVTLLACAPVTAVAPTAGPPAETEPVPVTETMAAPPATEAPPPATEAPPPTATNTSTPFPTATPICDRATLISETYPDGSDFAPGATFTKTWRLRNAGTCTWTTGYDVVLDSGNPMGAPLENPLMGNVAPGQEVDISIVMTAPSAVGNYQGNWKLRNGAGVLFGLGAGAAPFWVNIDVVAPTATPTWQFMMPIRTFVFELRFPETGQVFAQVTIPAGGTGYATVSCPSGTIVVGGGFATQDQVVVYNSSKYGNGWVAYGKNYSASGKLLNGYAICLSHTAGTVTQASASVSIPVGDYGHAVATCPAGSVVTGGGYASDPDKLRVYNSSPEGNGWEAYADNKSGASWPLFVYAICLSGTTGVTTAVYDHGPVSGGATGGVEVACPSGLVTGGGFALQADLVISNTSMKTSASNTWNSYSRNTGGISRTMNVSALCLTFP